MNKKLRAIGLSCVLALSSVIPDKSAYAALPALALVSASAVTASGVATEISALSGMVNTIGIAALMFNFANGKSLSLQMATPLSGGSYASPVPPPAAPEIKDITSGVLATSAYVSVVSGYGANDGFRFQGGSYVYSDLASIAGAMLGDNSLDYPNTLKQGVTAPATLTGVYEVNGYATNPNCSAVTKGYFLTGQVIYAEGGVNTFSRCVEAVGNPCGKGYFLDGQCVLDDPYLAQTDNHTEILRTQGGWVNPTTNDADPMPASVRTSADSRTITFPTLMPDGTIKTMQVSIQTSPYPSVRFDQLTNADAQTVTRTTAVFDDLGQLREASSNPEPGQVTEADPYSVNPNASSTGTNTTVTDPYTFQFPTDYARIGEAGAAANVVKASVESFSGKFDLFKQSWDAFKTLFQTLSDKLTGTVEVSDPKDEAIKNDLKDSTAPLTEWAVPSHSSHCPTPSMTMDFFGGRTFTMTSHCEIAEANRDVIGAIFRIVFGIMAVFIVLGA